MQLYKLMGWCPPPLHHMQDMSTCNIMILMLRLIYVKMQFRAIIITCNSHTILSLILQVGAKVCHHYIVQEVGKDMRIERSNMKYCITFYLWKMDMPSYNPLTEILVRPIAKMHTQGWMNYRTKNNQTMC